MSDTRITNDQWYDLLTVERTRLERGHSGLKREMQAFLLQLKSGGIAGRTDNVRTVQAKRLWDIGVGRELGLPDFEAYHASIPEIPEAILRDDADYPLLVLVETRLGLKKLCDLGNTEFIGGDDEIFMACDDRHVEFRQPTWIRIQDGRKNHNRDARGRRKSFGRDELGLTALQGICTYLHHSQVVTDTARVDGHVMDLPGSIRRVNHGDEAYLRIWKGRPRLDWYYDMGEVPRYGPASRRAS